MVAQNIAIHLDTLFADRPRQWRPLIYCWRGGKRSGDIATWFNMIGWRANQLEGGYKAYRRHVLERLETLPRQFRYLVLLGHNGTGNTARKRGARGKSVSVLVDLGGGRRQKKK